MVNLKDNKTGMILIATLLVAMVVFILSGAYVTSSLVHNQSVQRQRDAIRAFYLAEKGTEYAFVESRNNAWNWRTHEIAATDIDSNGLVDDLQLVATPQAVSITDPGVQYNSATGWVYTIVNPQNPAERVEIKTYTDPAQPGETWVLSRAVVNGAQKLVRYKISRNSMFKCFFYYPGSTTLSNRTFDGKGVGKIFVNGNIYLHNVNFIDMAEISTNSSGYISKHSFSYEAPYQLDDMDGSRDGRVFLPELANPHIYSPSNPYPWKSSSFPPSAWPPYPLWNVNRHFYYDPPSGYTYKTATFNGVDLPVSLAQSWTWSKYNYGVPSTGGPEQDVEFYDANGNIADNLYWNQLIAAYNYIDPDFLTNKKYQRTNATATVNFLNTAYQASDWNAWLNANSLSGKIKEYSSGAKDMAPQQIPGYYSDLAQNNGLYIDGNISGGSSPQILLNGGVIGDLNNLPSWLTIKQFVNPLYSGYSSPTPSEVQPSLQKVIEIDVAQLKASGVLINNNVIYVRVDEAANNAKYGIKLVNAQELPDAGLAGNSNGLVVVSPYNVFLQGSFNHNPSNPNYTSKPSAVITNSRFYTLSAQFNDPQYPTMSLYPPGYPYELNYISAELTTYLNAVTQADKQAALLALEQKCQEQFILPNSFNIHSAPPANLTDLQSVIRYAYNAYNQQYMPNKVTSETVYNVAVATPEAPQGIVLERWQNESFGTAPAWSYQPKIIGAFVQLKNKWSAMYDTPDFYGFKRFRPNGTGIYSKYTFSPGTSTSYHATSPSAFLEYNTIFGSAGQGGLGAADLLAGTQSLWEEISPTDFNFNHHI